MDSEKLYGGYDLNFLGQPVELPKLNSELQKDLFLSDEFPTGVIPYIHYSLSISKLFKFPFFTAANIDGLNFKKAPRKDHWRKDPRVPDLQWGMEFYGAALAKFDRGHMTKREDVQWGDSLGLALKGADSTFFYTNAVPQHKNLNRSVWRSLEDYILATETVQNSLKVNVYTGPVLSENNPYFIAPVNGDSIRLPILFWKVVVFKKSDGNLYRVGFLMNQEKLLIQDGLVEQLELATDEDNLFMKFKGAGTYQVKIKLIEDLTGIMLPNGNEPYTDPRPAELIFEDINIDPDLESYSIDQELGFKIQNLTL